MSRKSKRSKANQFGQEPGAFVPASHQHGAKRNSRGVVSMEFEPTGVGMGDSISQYSRDAATYMNRKHGMSKGKKAAVIALVIVLAAAVAALGFYVFKEYQKNLINQDLHNLNQDELAAVDNELTGMTTFDEPFTMLLLGSDARSGDPSMGARTDTIILCRIDPIENKVSMISIPRDTMVDIEGVGTQKFNAAYTYGGPSGTIAAVKDLCGVDIDHYAEVNFAGLVGLIDAIGGIDVVVDEMVNDPDAGDDIIPEGEQHLDGEAALTFSRSRAYADGDFTRVSNQRKVIEAIIHRGLEAPATELYGLVQACTGFLTTDSGMDVDFIFSLADQMRHNNDKPLQLFSATVPASTSMIGGVSYVIADKAALAEMIKIFLEGGDITAELESSSIDSDIRSASQASGAGSIDDSYNYHPSDPIYTQPSYDYQQPNYDYGYGTGGGTGTDAGAGTGTDTGGGTGGDVTGGAGGTTGGGTGGTDAGAAGGQGI